MFDDRELVERLAAIDATPRVNWVAELRAELGAAWETADDAHLDSHTATLTLVEREPTPTPPSSGRRWLILIAAAAAVIAIALVGTRDADVTPADQRLATVTVPSTPPSRALPVTSFFAAGTYFVDELDGTPTPRISFTIGSGWRDPSEASDIAARDIMNESIGSIVTFSRPPTRVFSHACRPADGFHPGPVDTIDGLVAALREQEGWAEVGAPSDFSIDGYVGTAFQRTGLTDFSGCETGTGRTRLSMDQVTTPLAYEPGQTETLWVLDLEGTVVLISAGVWPGPLWAARADVAAAVLASIRIDRSSSPEAVASEPNLSTPLLLPVGGREWGVGALVPDLGQFTDHATLIDALVASGPLENQRLSDPNLRPSVSICADIVRYHEPAVGTLVHEATATLNGQVGVVLVFEQTGNSKEVHLYGTGEADQNGSCPQLIREPLHPGPATAAVVP